MNTEELRKAITTYNWYHSIDLGDGVITPGSSFTLLWDFIRKNCALVDFDGKRVIDIGCRDGLFSFMAEQRGAKEVVAIDNDLSPGAINLVIPHLKSRVQMTQGSVYDLSEKLGGFDITMMLGLLYHLRYPFKGLRAAVNATNQGGIILIEGGFFRGNPQNLPMLYCPFIDSNPYEPGSPSYFNPLGLIETMKAMGCEKIREDDLAGSDTNAGGDNNVRRGFFIFRRCGDAPEYLKRYWDGTHDEHTNGYVGEKKFRSVL